jgi:uncharacterized NAD(P)/FAD-binding protein YdhS
MSAFADDPENFAAWLAAKEAGNAESFAQRRLYGRYLEELLAAAQDEAVNRLKLKQAQVDDIQACDGREKLRLASGEAIDADAVILSIGNLEPATPRGFDRPVLGASYVADPWAGDIAAGLDAQDVVLLIGTGLTAIDAALTLDAAGFEGEIVAISRRGLVPRAHADPIPVPALPNSLTPRCSSLVRKTRAEAARIGWRQAVDQLRPVTQELWATAPAEERRRFLKHLRPWWDVHRHRIAPEIAERIAAMEQAGRLRIEAGRLLRASADGVVWRRRGEDREQTLRPSRIVNCTGPEGDIARAGEPLLANLLAAGRIRPDICRIGIDVDDQLRVIGSDGVPSGSLRAIGPMTRGAFWEIVAVPDIRGQVAALAARFRL